VILYIGHLPSLQKILELFYTWMSSACCTSIPACKLSQYSQEQHLRILERLSFLISSLSDTKKLYKPSLLFMQRLDSFFPYNTGCLHRNHSPSGCPRRPRPPSGMALGWGTELARPPSFKVVWFRPWFRGLHPSIWSVLSGTPSSWMLLATIIRPGPKTQIENHLGVLGMSCVRRQSPRVYKSRWICEVLPLPPTPRHSQSPDTEALRQLVFH